MNQDIIDRCVAALEQEDLDAIIAMSPENFAYVTGFIVPSQPILRWRHAAVVITRDGRRALFTVDMEATTVKDLESGEDVHVWEEFEEDAMPVLADLLRTSASARRGSAWRPITCPSATWSVSSSSSRTCDGNRVTRSSTACG